MRAGSNGAPTDGATAVQDALYAAAQLLGYPDAAWRAQLADIDPLIASLDAKDARTLGAFVEHARACDARAFESAYVDTFDFGKKTSMCLAGSEDEAASKSDMLSYAVCFTEAGYTTQQESPDYLPALLELASAVDADEAVRVLHACEPAASRLSHELRAVGSNDYAKLIDCVSAWTRRLESEVAA